MDLPLESLLRHSAWVERLARRLVRDPEAADELVQETWLAVLEAGEVPVRSARAWLATVLRSRLADRTRGAARREARERAAARPEAQPSTAELFLRTAAQHEVVEAVLALDEAYREVILRRYFQGEAPRVIAARLGVPLATVKTRLARALARLRATLDERHGGDGKRWLLALIPLVRPAPLVPRVALAAVAAAALLLALAPRLLRAWRAEASPALAALGAGPEEPPASADARPPALAQPARAALESASPSPPSFAGPAVAQLVRGRVRTADGAALAGVVLELRAAEPEAGTAIALSDARGAFELTTASTSFAVHVLDEERVTAWAGLADGAGGELVVVAAPACRATGRLVDEAGAPVAGAELALALPPRPASEASAPVEARATSGADGSFALERLPAVPGAVLEVTAQGYAPRRVPLASCVEALVELARDGDWIALHGRVCDERGAPLAGAHVSDGACWARCAADGAFELRVRALPARLVALAAGRLPLRLTAADGPLELVLAEPALEVRGRVLEADGTPLAGAWVWLDDPEPLAAPALDARDRLEAGVRLPGLAGPRLAAPLLESVLAGEPERGWRRVTSDAGGAFALGGLARRAYRLAALDPATLRLVRRADVAAGSAEVQLVFAPGSAPRPRVVRALAPDKTPLSGLGVQLECAAFRVPATGAALWSERPRRALGRTDAAGRLAFEAPEGAELELHLEGAAVLARTLALDGIPSDGTVELERACFVRVSVHDAGELGARDADGHELELAERVDGALRSRPRVPLRPGETRALVLGERARELVLWGAQGEPRSVPLRLVPGETLALEL